MDLTETNPPAAQPAEEVEEVEEEEEAEVEVEDDKATMKPMKRKTACEMDKDHTKLELMIEAMQTQRQLADNEAIGSPTALTKADSNIAIEGKLKQIDTSYQKLQGILAEHKNQEHVFKETLNIANQLIKDATEFDVDGEAHVLEHVHSLRNATVSFQESSPGPNVGTVEVEFKKYQDKNLPVLCEIKELGRARDCANSLRNLKETAIESNTTREADLTKTYKIGATELSLNVHEFVHQMAERSKLFHDKIAKAEAALKAIEVAGKNQYLDDDEIDDYYANEMGSEKKKIESSEKMLAKDGKGIKKVCAVLLTVGYNVPLQFVPALLAAFSTDVSPPIVIEVIEAVANLVKTLGLAMRSSSNDLEVTQTNKRAKTGNASTLGGASDGLDMLEGEEGMVDSVL